MGAVDLGGGGDRKKKGSGIKKPKRVGFSLDMTPLVDIAFLLLTFFMFATTMSQPKMMEMRIPPDLDSQVEVKQSTILTLFVDGENQLYYTTGADTSMKKVDLNKLRDFSIKRTMEKADNELITSLKLHPQASYATLVRVLDELNKAEGLIVADYTEKGKERKRKFSIQRLQEAEKERLEQL